VAKDKVALFNVLRQEVSQQHEASSQLLKGVGTLQGTTARQGCTSSGCVVHACRSMDTCAGVWHVPAYGVPAPLLWESTHKQGTRMSCSECVMHRPCHPLPPWDSTHVQATMMSQ
jgi:hypothetical protein